MKKVRAHIITTLRWCFLGLILLLGPIEPDITAQAENGRNFSGFLTVTDVVGGTTEVTLSLSLEVFNYSGVDLKNATLRMEQGFPGDTLYEFPTLLDIAYRNRTVITAPVLVVPREQYDQWRQGMLPRFKVTYSDGNGLSRSLGVELVPGALDPGIQP